MAAQQRKLLERLMGSAEGPSEIDFNDASLCKAYCVDFCVADLFVGTKASVGRCPYVHIERAQMLYRSREAKIPSFEREFDRSISKAAAAVKRRVAAAEQSLEAEDAAHDSSGPLQQQIAALCEELASAGRRGQINGDTALKLQELETKRAELRRLDAGPQQRLQVCQVCASYLSPAESDKRLADHFLGKIHRAYAQVFDAIDERQHTRK